MTIYLQLQFNVKLIYIHRNQIDVDILILYMLLAHKPTLLERLSIIERQFFSMSSKKRKESTGASHEVVVPRAVDLNCSL